MAPIRSRARSRAVNAGRKAGSMNNKLDVADRIPESKSDKRRIKHSLLVAKAQASARVQKPALKRRRPAKKLRAAESLENLVASLPEVAKEQLGDIQNGKRSNSGTSGGALASKPGVQKRRDAITRQEQERFSKNLANINTQSKSRGTDKGTSHWLALRQHVSRAMQPDASPTNANIGKDQDHVTDLTNIRRLLSTYLHVRAFGHIIAKTTCARKAISRASALVQSTAMHAACLRSASRPLLREGFFSTSFSTPSGFSRPSIPSVRVQLPAAQRHFYAARPSAFIIGIPTKHIPRFAPTSTRFSLQTHTRHESTSTAPASAAAAPVSSSEPPTSLTWNDFFRLRQRRRYINVGASALTASASLITGVGVIAAQDLEALQIFGLDPMIAGGIACLVCAGAGWLMGPLLGTVVFRLFVGRMSEMGAKERDFYGRIRRYRVDPSNSSMQNPVPDYYGEKITSVRGYRQWLKDQKAFRRKRESLM
ncbi:MAG: hypothetical protein Q9159_001237 [Coniocarpon cinnabarinum]